MLAANAGEIVFLLGRGIELVHEGVSGLGGSDADALTGRLGAEWPGGVSLR